jgi:methylglutaconyl-CoA hydratase
MEKPAMSDQATEVLCIRNQPGVVEVTLNRPEVHNAFNDAVIARLTGIFQELAADPAVRVILLCANGSSFSAGADLNWMKRMAGYTEAQNRDDALGLARMLRTLNELPKPTVAIVQGPAFAGGCGLVAACDIAIAVESAQFALTEVKLGLIPATIGPYVLAAIGARACRRFFLTAERFSAKQALDLGLVHALAPAEELRGVATDIVNRLLEAGPSALAESKRLIRDLAGRPVDDALMTDTAERIAAVRASAEGRDGVGSFLEKRKPGWR